MRSQEQFSSATDLARFLDFLLERGITTLDTAATYGAPYTVEKFLGQALKLQGKRDKFEVVTKLGIRRPSDLFPEHRLRHFDMTPEYMKWSVDRSLKELGIDHIDVLIVHRADHLMNADEAGAALDGLVKKGKVGYIGVSNFAPSRLELLQSRMKNPIVTNQVQFSPIFLRHVGDGTFDLAQKLGHVPMIWSPVGGGKLLTSNDEKTVNIRNLLTAIAERTGLPGAAEAAMAFVARHPARGIPIVGSGKRERVDGAIQAVNHPMERQDWYEVVAQTTESLELW
jgi:predicted oxidoreductase